MKLQVTAGGRAELKIHRLNIAERLYRITGVGIYQDSLAAGLPVPLRAPLLNGGVIGQDTVSTGIYRSRIFWIWGHLPASGTRRSGPRHRHRPPLLHAPRRFQPRHAAPAP